MGNAKDKYFKKLYESGMATHDRVFRLPFWDEWYEEMKSDIADLKNIGGANAGMITAGKFLEHFVKYPYIHLDIAGPAYLESPDSYQGKGGTGAGVRLLYDFLKNWE
jgi:leucyl aminopeptidase